VPSHRDSAGRLDSTAFKNEKEQEHAQLILGHLVYLYTHWASCLPPGRTLGGDWVWLGGYFGMNIMLDTLSSAFHTKGAPPTEKASPSVRPLSLI